MADWTMRLLALTAVAMKPWEQTAVASKPLERFVVASKPSALTAVVMLPSAPTAVVAVYSWFALFAAQLPLPAAFGSSMA